MWIRALDRLLMRVIYPSGIQCIACGRPSRGGLICGECREALEAERLTAEDGGAAVWEHRGVARKLVHRLKYDAMADAAEVLAPPMAEAARSAGIAEDTVITWVPMPASRRRERGIDHGRVLAEAVARELQLTAKPLIKRTAQSPAHTQQGLGREERLKNLSAAFACACETPMHILLVDDVTTTGATAQACTDCLTRGGAQSVVVMTATRSKR